MQIASIRTTCHICNADRPPMTDQESHFLAADELNHKARTGALNSLASHEPGLYTII